MVVQTNMYFCLKGHQGSDSNPALPEHIFGQSETATLPAPSGC